LILRRPCNVTLRSVTESLIEEANQCLEENRGRWAQAQVGVGLS